MPTVVAMQVELADVHNLYSPERLNRMLLLGGWKTPDDVSAYLQQKQAGVPPDQIIGPDKIWRSRGEYGAWGEPEKLLEMVGYHINDPTIIKPNNSGGVDRSSWRYLYYTGLRNIHADPIVFSSHVIGFASSGDEGQTWYNHGIIHAVPWGAWSPSALVVGTEIWVIYNNMLGMLRRVRFDMNGWQVLGPDEDFNQLPSASNPDLLQMPDGTFSLLANAMDLTKILRWTSPNGSYPWYPQGALIDGGAAYVLTPHQEWTGSALRVRFGWDPDQTGSHSIHAWDFAL